MGHCQWDGCHLKRLLFGCTLLATLDSSQILFELIAQLVDLFQSLPPSVRERTIVDPCLGFGKNSESNMELLRCGAALTAATGAPVLIGASRKRFLGAVTGLPVDQRDAATVGASLAAIAGGAQLVRVHDVAMTMPAVRLFYLAHLRR